MQPPSHRARARHVSVSDARRIRTRVRRLRPSRRATRAPATRPHSQGCCGPSSGLPGSEQAQALPPVARMRWRGPSSSGSSSKFSVKVGRLVHSPRTHRWSSGQVTFQHASTSHLPLTGSHTRSRSHSMPTHLSSTQLPLSGSQVSSSSSQKLPKHLSSMHSPLSHFSPSSQTTAAQLGSQSPSRHT